MIYLLVFVVIIVVILGSIATLFHTSVLGAVGIVSGFAVVLGLLVFLVRKLSKRFPKIDEHIGEHGFKLSAFTIAVGIITAVIGFFVKNGTEVRSYKALNGDTVFYLADVISPLLWLGIVLAFVGFGLLVTSVIIGGSNRQDKDDSSSDSEETVKTWTWSFPGVNKTDDRKK